MSGLKREYTLALNNDKTMQGYDPFQPANVQSTSPDNYDPNVSVSGYKLEYNVLNIANC